VLDPDNNVIGVFVSHTREVPDRAAFIAANRFYALLDFSLLPPGTLRALVFLAETGSTHALQLTTAVEAGMKIASNTLGRAYDCEGVWVNDCFSGPDRYAATVRQLCVTDVVVFDLTSYEPGIMLLLGVRSAVRRGVTIGSTSLPLTVGTWADAPFNIKELNLVSHSAPKIGTELIESILGRRIIYGLKALATTPRYRDSVCYEAVRYLLPSERAPMTARVGALVLCSYDSTYDRQWEHVKAAIGSHLEQEFPTSRQQVSRAIDLNLKSGRLASETIYGEIRRAELCVVDWSAWSANVFFELGVRLAVSRFGAECVIDPSFPLLPHLTVPTEQSRLLLELFQPHRYSIGAIGYGPFDEVLKDHLAKTGGGGQFSPTSTYEIASASADTKSEAASVPVYRELLEASRVLGSNDSLGISGLIYPGNKTLLKQSEAAADARLLAAWEFMSAVTLDSLKEDPEAEDTYLDLCRLLAPAIRLKYPAKAKKMLRAVRAGKGRTS
jgi:hypothetical protein